MIPDFARMRWIVRAPSREEVEDLYDRVRKCMEAGALASACQVEIELTFSFDELLQNSELGSSCLQHGWI